MKRIIIVILLLILCVSASGFSLHHTRQVSEHVLAGVDRSIAALAEGDEPTLHREVAELTDYWTIEEDNLVHFIRHAQVDEITKAVARLKALAAGEDYSELAAELASIRWQMNHIDHCEQITWHNLF